MEQQNSPLYRVQDVQLRQLLSAEFMPETDPLFESMFQYACRSIDLRERVKYSIDANPDLETHKFIESINLIATCGLTVVPPTAEIQSQLYVISIPLTPDIFNEAPQLAAVGFMFDEAIIAEIRPKLIEFAQKLESKTIATDGLITDIKTQIETDYVTSTRKYWIDVYLRFAKID